MDSLEEFEKALAADKAEREREGRDEGRPEKREKHRHGHDQGPDPDKARDGGHHHHHHHRRRHRSHGRDGADDPNPGDDDQGHRPKRSRRHSPDHDRTRHHRRRDEDGGDRAAKRTDHHPHHRHHRRRDEDDGHEDGGLEGGGHEDRGREGDGHESGDDRPARRTHTQHHRPSSEHEGGGGGNDTDPSAKPTHRHHRPRDRDRRDASGDDDPSERHQRQRRPGAPNTDAPALRENEGAPPPLVRDAWMTTPSALEIDYVQRQARRDKKPARTREEPDATAAESRYTLRMEPEPPPPPPRRRRGDDDDDYCEEEEEEEEATRTFNYTIGDEGAQWRMTKLRGVYTTAKESGRSVEEVALGRFGTIREFDDAREEQDELERRRIYGQGYARKERPTGELYRERKSQEADRKKKDGPVLITQKQQQASLPAAPAVPMDQTALNRLRARLMKAKLRKDPAAAALEAEYDAAVAAMASGRDRNTVVVLGAMHHRELAGVGGPNGAAALGEVKPVQTRRGRERGLVGENSDMTVDDMVREERRTRGQPGGEGRRLAERIARDDRFTDNLEYMDENAEKLARRVHRSDVSLRHVAADEYQRLSRALESCPLCYGDDETPPRPPAAPVVALGTRTYLTLPPEPELSPLGAVIVPLQHRANLLGCDDDEWEEIRNFMKGLTRLHHDMGREVVFYENAATSAAAASRRHHRHAALVAVSIPYEHGATAPAFFREAMLSADEEWAQHRKVIDTQAAARDKGLGRMAFRRSIAREMPYFHVWFTLDGGLGHVVEDEARWPRGDLFAREVLGGIMDVDPAVIKKQGRWRRGEPAGSRLDEFKARWRPFDWTRVLREEEETSQQRSQIETG